MTVGLCGPSVCLVLQQGPAPGNANLPLPPNPSEGGTATRIVQLTEAVTMEELANDEEYQDILDDMRDECGKVCTPPPPTTIITHPHRFLSHQTRHSY